jgi:proline iminopeptidase
MAEERVEVGGASLWTVTEGGGRPVVLCHGGPGGWDDLGGLAAMLTDVATVHRYDQRACGRSSGESPRTMAELVAELEALRRHWGHERWVAGGHSAGAALALAYAVEHPERVEAVLYVSGTGLDWRDWREAYHAAADARLTAEQRAERDRLRASLDGLEGAAYREAHDAYCRLQWSTDFADRQRALDLAARLLEPGLLANFEVNRDVNADWGRMRGDPAWRGRLATLDRPVLAVHGEGDPRPLDAVRGLVEALPRARLEVVPGGHYPWMEQPEPLRRVLRDWLASLAAAR